MGWLTPLGLEARIGAVLFQGQQLTLGRKKILLLALIGLAALAILLRCLHLFDSGHYFILSPDSYFFHWLSGRIMSGQGPPPDAPSGTIYSLHTGLAYPLAYIAKALGYIFNLSYGDALNIASKLVPPVLGVLGIVVMYWGASRIFDRRAGLFSALAWVLMPYVLLVGAAGYIDRDSFSLLLITIGAFLFYLSKDWHLSIGNRDVGWLIAGLGVLVIEGLLYLEWVFIGAMLLLAVITAYFVVKFLLEYFDRIETEPNTMRRISAAIGETNWRTFALIIAGNIVAAASNLHQVSSWFSLAASFSQTTQQNPVAEMQGLGVFDFLGFQFFLIPMALGIYVAWKKRNQGAIFLSCWFVSLFILSLFAKRVMIYAAPAACLLSGVGLVFLCDWRGWNLAKSLRTELDYLWNWPGWGSFQRFRMRWCRFQTLKKGGIAILLLLAILISFLMGYSESSSYGMAPDRQWQDALVYLRQETPPESVIMSQWSWGYWILDLGQRRPLVDNGYYYYDPERLNDIALVYYTTKPSEAVQLMDKYGAAYLVFSTLDLKVAKTILGWANLSEEHSSFPGDSLVASSLDGQFESGGGLRVVYRNSEVVILGLTQPRQS